MVADYSPLPRPARRDVPADTGSVHLQLRELSRGRRERWRRHGALLGNPPAVLGPGPRSLSRSCDVLRPRRFVAPGDARHPAARQHAAGAPGCSSRGGRVAATAPRRGDGRPGADGAITSRSGSGYAGSIVFAADGGAPCTLGLTPAAGGRCAHSARAVSATAAACSAVPAALFPGAG